MHQYYCISYFSFGLLIKLQYYVHIRLFNILIWRPQEKMFFVHFTDFTEKCIKSSKRSKTNWWHAFNFAQNKLSIFFSLVCKLHLMIKYKLVESCTFISSKSIIMNQQLLAELRILSWKQLLSLFCFKCGIIAQVYNLMPIYILSP